MKLIIFKTLFVSFAATTCGQKFQQDHYPFPPQFQTPSSAFTSDSSIYLPPESHTPIPYFTMNNLNKLPFQFLPPTGTKSPSMYPTSFPMYMSSTLRFEDDVNEEIDSDEKSNIPTPVSNRTPQNYFNRANNSTTTQAQDKKDSILNSRMLNHQISFHQPSQSRFEVKAPSYVTIGPKEREQKSINPAARRMIITSEIQKADQIPDQAKAASYQAPQYIQAAGVFISSTTEPAIPILRLSNEMDLDGSFSYEALGADQTHYVQHSHMENMGSDKEEQVVEGSYSYIGDDGRTYTVHYVADSNGYRATGDHLPVPPPIPEIIQRAVQFNLAEEAKKPPHLKSSWENDDKEYEINERSFYNNPPSRSLFTGKTPEAFSFGYSQGSNIQNNLVAAESFQVPAKQNHEMQQSKPKINPMPTPQITFAASQGAHNPSVQSQLPKANIEKSVLPQLINYEAEIKDSDQEPTKALWRWQYGLNTNMEQNPKKSISRSFAEGDDVVINFSDMTPDQYTNMINSQVLSQNAKTSNGDYNAGESYQPSYGSQIINETLNEQEKLLRTTDTIKLYSNNNDKSDTNQKMNNEIQKQTYKQEDKLMSNKMNSGIHSEIISRHNFIPQSQIATQSYTFDETSFEPSKLLIPSGNSAVNLNAIQKLSENDLSSNFNVGTSTIEPIFNNLKTELNYYNNEENSSFRPITYRSETTTKHETTEASMNEALRDNIFLRNLFKPSYNEEKVTNKSVIEKIASDNQEVKHDKESKYFHIQENPQNEFMIINKQTSNANSEYQETKHDKDTKYIQQTNKIIKSKPLDINNILNYVVLKNHFESIKTKQKNKPTPYFIQNSNVKDIPNHYTPIKENTNYYVEPNDDDIQKQDKDFKTFNRQQQQELQGLIKNYKVLQRQKNNLQKSQPLPEPQRHIKAFHTQNLPPLGRAGPSMKSYLPPTYL